MINTLSFSKMRVRRILLNRIASVFLLICASCYYTTAQVYNAAATITKKVDATGVSSIGLTGITTGVTPNPGVRGWFYFNIASIPQGSTITSAVLNYPTANGTQNSSSLANQLNALSFDPQLLSGTALYNALSVGAPNVSNLFTGRWAGVHPVSLNTSGPLGGDAATAANLLNHIQNRVNFGNTFLAFSLIRGSNNLYNFQTPSLTVNFTPPPPCITPPTAGNAAVTQAFACPSVLRTFSLTSGTFGSGQIFQWQSSHNNVSWTNISGATASQYQTTVVTNAWYRCFVTCSGASDTSTSVQATVDNYLACYCPASYPNGCNVGDQISNVVITGTTLNNSSGCAAGAYIFYNTPAHNLTKTIAYTLSITLGNDALAQYTAAWLDFDQSGSFEVSELIGNQTTSVGANGTAVFNFSIPLTALNGQTRLRIRGGDDGPIADDQSCGNTTNAWGETEDYLINISNPAPCTDPPIAGIITAPDSVCSQSNFQLLASGFSTGTTLQWQSSVGAGGPFTDIAGETNAVLSITNYTSALYYRLKVTCTTNSFTPAKQITLKSFFNCLCPATYVNDCSLNNEITNVTLNNLNNSSACSPGSYIFYTSLTAPDLAQTVTYSLTVSMSSNPLQFAGAWIDYNQNGLFEGAEFLGGNTINSGANGTAAISFSPPVNAITGVTVLRIRGGHDVQVASTEGCGLAFSNYGETEDYFVSILPQPLCIDPPVAGTISGNLNVCSGESASLTLSGFSSNTLLQWQESLDGINFTDVAGANTSTLITNAITVTTYYRVQVECVNIVYSLPVQITLNNFLTCYCINNLNSAPCGNGHITNVNIATTTLNNPSGCSQQGTSGAYASYPATGSTTATLLRNVYYNLSVQSNGIIPANVSVWIDFNQNAIFEASEYTQVYTNNITGTIPVFIPLGALLGQTGMRIRSAATATLITANDACASYSSGETEDYIVTIGNAPLCTNPPVAGTISGNLFVCTGTNVSLTLNGYTLGSLLQWQTSNDGITFSDIVGASQPFLTATVNAVVYFRAFATCANSDTTAAVQINLKPFYECYCYDDLNPIGCGNGDIVNVAIAATALNNNSTCSFSLPAGAFISYPASGSFTASLQKSVAYNFSVTTDVAQSPVSLSIWIDFNQDGLFSTSEWQQVFANGNNGNVNITIPTNAVTGLTGMRVRSRFAGDSNGAGDACERFTSGETEDYLITITAPPLCTDPPIAGTISGNFNVCNADVTLLSLNGFSPGSTLQWQSSPDGVAWTDILNANNISYTTLPITVTTYYRVKVTCTTDAFSPAIIVNVVNCILMQNGSTTLCSGNFYDDGGSSVNYSGNQNLIFTIFPTTGNLLQIIFNVLDLENGFDFLKIYNGNNTGAPQIGPLAGYTGNSFPGTLTSGAADGSLTFEFISNGTNNLSGWSSTISCVANVCSGIPVSGVILQPTLNCINETTSLVLSGASGGAGITYQWQESDDDGVTDPYTDITGAFSTTYNTPIITQSKFYRVNVICTNSSQSVFTAFYQVQFKPEPEGLILSNTPVCNGSTIFFFAFNTATGQSSGNSFLWTGPNGFNSIAEDPTVAAASFTDAGYYVVNITNQSGCVVADSILAEVNPNPVLSEGQHIDVTCNTGADGSVDIDAANGTAPYLFNDFVNYNFDGIFNPLTSGVYTFNVHDSNGCIASITVNITEPPPVTIANAGADQTICLDSASISANTAIVGAGSWSFVSGSGVINDALNPQTYVTTLASGINILRWTIKYNTCPDSSYDEVNITAGAVPTATLYGNSDICIGNNAQINIDFTGTPPWNYSYTDGNTIYGPFNTSNITEIITVSPTVSSSYALINVVADNCNGNVSGIANITVSTTAPTQQTTALDGLPSFACIGTTANLTCATVVNATHYIWGAPAGSYFDGNPANISPYVSSGNSATLTFGAPTSSGYVICAGAANGCGAALQRCKWIRGITSVPAKVIGNPIACENTIEAYSTGIIVGATGYSWTSTGGIAVASGNGTQNITASFPPGFTQGDVCVSATNSCYVSVAKCATIKNSVDYLQAITGPRSVCPGSTPYFYSTQPTYGVSSYNWNLPPFSSGNSTGNSIGIVYNAGFGNNNVCVTGIGICGINTAPKCFSVTTGVPPTPSAIVGTATAVCGQTIIYTSASVQGATGYNWTVPSGATINSGQGNNAINVTYSTIAGLVNQVCVTTSSNCIGANTPRCITVKGLPNNPGGITANPTAICANQEGVVFTVPPVSGNYLISWLVPNDAVIVLGQSTNSITVDFGVLTGNVIATASNACGNSSSTYFIDLICPVRNSAAEFVKENNQQFELFPNPTTGKFYFYFNGSNEENYSCVITDVLGKSILSKNGKLSNEKNKIDIDISGNPAGIYFVNIVYGRFNKVMKITKQ